MPSPYRDEEATKGGSTTDKRRDASIPGEGRRETGFRDTEATAGLDIMAKFQNTQQKSKSDSLSKYRSNSDRKKHTIVGGGDIYNNNELIYLEGGPEKLLPMRRGLLLIAAECQKKNEDLLK